MSRATPLSPGSCKRRRREGKERSGASGAARRPSLPGTGRNDRSGGRTDGGHAGGGRASGRGFPEDDPFDDFGGKRARGTDRGGGGRPRPRAGGPLGGRYRGRAPGAA